MAGDRQVVDVLLGVLDAGGVRVGVEFTVDGQSGGRGGVADQVDDDLVGFQWPAAPVHGDLGEQPVLDLVPLAGSRWEVADRDLDTGLGGETSQLDLPGPDRERGCLIFCVSG